MKQYFEVDKLGKIIGTDFFDEGDAPDGFKLGWIDEIFFEPVWDYFSNKWVEGKQHNDVLLKKKESKIHGLNSDCRNSILNGFDCELNGINYHFSYDQEAQINFQDTIRLFDNNMIEMVNWNATLHEGKVRLTLDKIMFEKVYLNSVKHKLDTISKYRDELIPMLNNASTNEEVDKITWDSVKEAAVKSVVKTDGKIDKKVSKLEMDTVMIMGGLLEVSNMVIMGGMK